MDDIAIQLDELVLGDHPSGEAVADRLRHAPAARMLAPETLDAIADSVAATLRAEPARPRP